MYQEVGGPCCGYRAVLIFPQAQEHLDGPDPSSAASGESHEDTVGAERPPPETAEPPALRKFRQDQAQLLDLIDDLQALGLSSDIKLPQLIVAGDQSSGKSSVLEAISGVQFPTNDGLCTTFATEFILRRAPISAVSVTINPYDGRTEDEKNQLKGFTHDNVQLDNVATVITSAKELLSSCSTSGTGTFFRDILRISITRPDGPILSMVDLPGIIHNDQSGTEDVAIVKQVVKGYMDNPEGIILAVVTAKNDVANQVVLQWARNSDRDGSRTVGLITMPDKTNDGSDSQRDILTLAKNQRPSFMFKLGWHVLRNRDYTVLDPCPSALISRD
jgi:GTPase SAR1 family protein